MNGLKNLLASDHGLLGLLLILCATALTFKGSMTIEQWQSFAQTVFIAFGGTHAAVAIAGALKRPLAAQPALPAVTPTATEEKKS